MKASLQSRVLGLVGVGVLLAVAALGLLTRSSLLSLDKEVRHDHERLAAAIAREISRAVGHDLRLLAGAADASPDALATALHDVRRFGHLASAAFVVDHRGMIVACQPAFECSLLRRDMVLDAAREATATGRPFVGDPLEHEDGRRRLASAMPARGGLDKEPDAIGIIIDPSDLRLSELLDPSEIAATLSVILRDGGGKILARTRDGDLQGAFAVSAPVTGTRWTLELKDVGSDPTVPLTEFRRRWLWLAPTLAALAMLLGWGIARSVRQPLMYLTAAAERIARGDLARRIDTGRAAAGGDEVARLAAALERMRNDLETSIREIERSNEELERRIADRTRELAAVNVRLEERERLRQKLLRQVISAQEDERKRIARELHDETSQTLAALGMGVDLALAAGGEAADGAAHARLEEVRKLVDRMHQELHRMIMNLRPSVLDDLGLAAAIRWFAERHLESAGITVRCEFSGLDERLPPDVETATFRAVQEALVNVARHSQADLVLLQASLADGTLTIEIEDDGCGFDEAAMERSPDSLRGIGLLGMRERIEILGGTLTIESEPGSGTRVLFSIPAVPLAKSERSLS
jgi:signal transduction histidine kinase